ncbi:50S ribosomal protein L17 [Candidatus Collierbacteria bacterium RIFOXYB1_FULL_49_13]|uniref:50S ribosomal protein L17 n=1 Tax=Candidatus Collierbacteria bacterium RIFOXYB1_FULL_49_13 TaxID=1817728 RepID=A0A1F5FHP9_9BACT|nr:MAG: 50S ribosomal protein L17 [Candidatus Collierbacteria bacterium RIFOXYB1_FULL_49_13]
MSRRHQVFGRKLGRNINQRKSLFKSLINSLIARGEISTTQAKAKAIQGLFDKLVTKAKLGTVHMRRLLHAFLQDKSAVNKLVDELAPKFGSRGSGFTSITKLGHRRGDNAEIVKLTLVGSPTPATPVTPAAPTAPKTKKTTTKKPLKSKISNLKS